MIDCHVHLRDWKQAEKETILHGASLATEAGFTALFDMPNTSPPLIDVATLKRRIEYGQVEVAKINSKNNKKFFYGVYGGLTSNKKQITEIIQYAQANFPNCVGVKMFAGHSTGNLGLTTEKEQFAVYKILAELNYRGVIAVHCEKESHIKNELFEASAPQTHSLARPAVAETESIADQIHFVQKSGFKGHLHICHISTALGIKLVNEAKKAGIKISCGATAHHALLNEDAYKKHGICAKMNPPLRDKENQKAVFSALLTGEIDCIESDHAPHTLAEKNKGFSGIPGFAGSLRLIKTLREHGAPLPILQKLCGTNANKIFGTNFEVRVPSNETINTIFPKIKNSYQFNIF
ncbi:MAG: dihydroorotase family protein [Treponemataceae bacterium]